MINTRHLRRAGALAAFGASVTVALSGCGGSSTNGSLTPNTVADPIVFGINYNNGLEGSNIAFPSADGTNTNGAVIGAISSTATGLPNEGGINPGFVPGGQNIIPVPAATDKGQTGMPPFLSFGFALPASQPSCVFRALVGNGNITNSSGGIDPNSLFLTTPEVAGFKQHLTFDAAGIGVGPAGNGQYTSTPFTLPFTTTGLHTFITSVADQSGKSSTTTFQTLVLAPTDSAVVVQVMAPRKPGVAVSRTNPSDPIGGALVTVTNALPGVAAYESTTDAPQTSVTDGNGVAIVFCAPGQQTITATADPASATDLGNGKPVAAMVTGSDQETLVAGQALTAVANTSSAQGDALSSAYAIEMDLPAAASARQGHSRVQGHFVKRH